MATQLDMFPADAPATLDTLLSPDALLEVFETKFARSVAKGVDRLSGFQYVHRAKVELSKASDKCIAGTYRFSPYVENLKTKGRSKAPRLISIPTIRDRVVLHQLNKVLATIYPDCVPKNIANRYVRTIVEELESKDPSETFVCGADIKNFYDAIRQERLLSQLSKKIENKALLTLIRRALVTPTVTKNARRSEYGNYKADKGVPQGLAISNILAAIYLAEVDIAMKKLSVSYFRYVDDVLIYGSEELVRKAHKSLGARLRQRGLALHNVESGKSHLGQLAEPFGYLGYAFQWPIITVRAVTIEKLLQSIASKFSDFKHNKTHRLQKHRYLTEERLAEIFLLELNERISGAISEKRRYGWIAYFNQINDLSLLHRLDHTVSSLFSRLEEFQKKPPDGLKRFARAYYEMKFNAAGGYVHDYDKIQSIAAKLHFLVERGRVGAGESLTDEQIAARFERYRNRVLSTMHQDEQALYG